MYNWYCCIAMIQLYKYTDTGKSETLTTLLFWYETFINFLTFSFSTRGERETPFLLCWLFLHRPQSPPPQLD